MIGETLGHYKILDELGKGGMGEVYRARDTRLDRDVAVKVLPQALAKHRVLRARFEREAKTISALSHPHICVLHDVGRSGDVDFLVMELLEGETLAKRLMRGPLPLQDVLTFGKQIADALDRAHCAGVVHRDLKPSNVMLTRAGAKLMDFGLASVSAPGGPADAPDPAALPASQSPTLTHPLTAEGTILGTFHYMAPEQLEGGDADTRADLWALGCVLYEMTTARPAFESKNKARLIAAILHATPEPPSRVIPSSPPGLDRLIAACLTRDRDERIRSAHDVKLQMEWMADDRDSTVSDATSVTPETGDHARWLTLAFVVLATAAVTAFGTARVLRDGRNPRGQGVERYVLGSYDLHATSAPALSPDGTYVVFSAHEGDSHRLYRRSLSTFEAAPVSGTEGAYGPFFSPDGSWIGFVTDDAIKKVPAAGGVPQRIATYMRPSSGDWGAGGMIYFTARSGGEDGNTALARVPDVGGTVEVVATLETRGGESESWLPEILPDGETVLVSVGTGDGSSPRIVAVKHDGSKHTIIPDAFFGRYLDSGHIVYRDAASKAILAAPFDPNKVEVTGPATPLTEEVSAMYCFDVHPGGALVYVPAAGTGIGNEIVWLDEQGGARPITDMKANWTQPRVSPDGKRIAVRKAAADCELWMVDLERGSLSRIVQEGDIHNPVWSPDGRSIAFSRDDVPEIVILTLDSPPRSTTLVQGAASGDPQSWAAGLLAYTSTGRGTRNDIWVRRIDGSAESRAFLATAASESHASLSPDGNWIAYRSDETGTAEVYIRAYPDAGTVWRVSSGGASDPLWSHDGRELYYVAATHLMVASIAVEPTLHVGPPRKLLTMPRSDRTRNFDVAPDGRVVTVRTAPGVDDRAELRLLVNWQQAMAQPSAVAH